MADASDFVGIINDVEFCLKNDWGINPEQMAKFIHELYMTARGE